MPWHLLEPTVNTEDGFITPVFPDGTTIRHNIGQHDSSLWLVRHPDTSLAQGVAVAFDNGTMPAQGLTNWRTYFHLPAGINDLRQACFMRYMHPQNAEFAVEDRIAGQPINPLTCHRRGKFEVVIGGYRIIEVGRKAITTLILNQIKALYKHNEATIGKTRTRKELRLLLSKLQVPLRRWRDLTPDDRQSEADGPLEVSTHYADYGTANNGQTMTQRSTLKGGSWSLQTGDTNDCFDEVATGIEKSVNNFLTTYGAIIVDELPGADQYSQIEIVTGGNAIEVGCRSAATTLTQSNPLGYSALWAHAAGGSRSAGDVYVRHYSDGGTQTVLQNFTNFTLLSDGKIRIDAQGSTIRVREFTNAGALNQTIYSGTDTKTASGGACSIGGFYSTGSYPNLYTFKNVLWGDGPAPGPLFDVKGQGHLGLRSGVSL